MLSANQSDFNFAMSDSLSEDVRGISNVPQAGFNKHLMTYQWDLSLRHV